MYSVQQTFIEGQYARHWVGHQYLSSEEILDFEEFVHFICAVLCLSKVLFKIRTKTSVFGGVLYIYFI